ncbi:MAG: acylphosphatase [Nocardioides sp.]
MTSSSVDLVVRGRVQGVGFRFHAVERAEDLGVTGWVRNEPDGSVACHLEGPADAVGSLVDWCRQGPHHARVETVDVHDVPAIGAPTFDVRF